MRIGYTAGTFDLFHAGHLRFLQIAAAICDRLIVGVSTDELTANYKGQTPIVPYEQRAEILRALRCVDAAIAQRDLDKHAAWQRLRYDILIGSEDWRHTARWMSYERKLRQEGVPTIYLPYTAEVTSTLVKQRIRQA